jgi:murein DD-endopeptidase MepM/ murein hydrolase activator NlpD
MNKFLLIVLCCLPLHHLSLTSGFGYRVHPVTGKYSFHSGIDLKAHSDTVFAVLSGTVNSTGFNPFLGVFIRLAHADFETSYGHLSQIFVLPGDSVSVGDTIGITGATGRVTGEHLHFSVCFKGRPIDPVYFLEKLVSK